MNTRLKSRLDSLRPLPEHTVRTLHEQQVLEGIAIGGKPLREHFEVINHKEAIDYVEAIVQNREALSEWQIKSIHHLGLMDWYRKATGLDFPSPQPSPAGEGALPLHPVECAARLHADFVGIHPFVDGNVRTSRLLMNFELIRRGFLLVIIPVENRLAYYDALDTAHTRDDYSLFIELVASLVQAALIRYLDIIEGNFGNNPCLHR